ncbi:uncharacterized protein LOC117642303 [Thrips palmi]|uniref:Uncharacterized protein LOC117642303 n=1 Tax=Thrips palmi TaxID=161013 RepID=A0A6P8YI27_THRPL|nr:uncharacterized protein LOC117642303 [Thrips palmi]
MPAGVLEVAAKAVVLLLLALLGTATSAVTTVTTSTASSAAANANLGSINLQGARKPGDQLLFEYRVTRRAKPFKVITEAVVYPMTTGQKPGVITLIEVRSPKRRHDEVHIKSGGVGERSATILLKSARGRGLDVVVNIFGIPANAKPTSASPEAGDAGDATADGDAAASASQTSTSGDEGATTTAAADAER